MTNHHKLGDSKQQIYSFTVLEAQGQTSGCQQGHHAASSSFWWWLPPSGCVTSLCLHQMPFFPLYLCPNLPFLSIIRTPAFGFRVHSYLVLPHLHLVISAKTLFLNKVTFIGARGKDFSISFLGAQFNPHHPICFRWAGAVILSLGVCPIEIVSLWRTKMAA